MRNYNINRQQRFVSSEHKYPTGRLTHPMHPYVFGARENCRTAHNMRQLLLRVTIKRPCVSTPERNRILSSVRKVSSKKIYRFYCNPGNERITYSTSAVYEQNRRSEYYSVFYIYCKLLQSSVHIVLLYFIQTR